jgi:hypothetical protein
MTEQKMSKAALVVTIALVGIISVGGITGHAQAAHGGDVSFESEASADRVGTRTLHVNRDSCTLGPVKAASPVTRPVMRSAWVQQAPTSNRSRARARSKTRILAGAIAGGVGGFFAGGFLGARIEGDRCNCDDPGVRGFLIGAPIGAVAGGILGAKLLF